MNNDIPALVIAYKRADNLKQIFDICKKSGVTRFYFSVDGPASSQDSDDVEKVREVISEFASQSDLTVHLRFSAENLGCAASVISSCDWFFLAEKSGIIIEDDCIPSSDFFEFMRDAIPLIDEIPNVWLASGTQFFSEAFVTPAWILSDYPMHWGWGTTSRAWAESRRELEVNPPTLSKFIKSLRNPELVYWFAGERRAFYGFTDVWDSIYASNMFRLGKKAIIPSSNLVTNTGNDAFATNTLGEQRYTQLPSGKYQRVSSQPYHFLKYDQIVRRNFFGISFLHYFSTLSTLVLDYFFLSRKILPHLDSRLEDTIFKQ